MTLKLDEREALFATARRLPRGALGVEGDGTVEPGFRCDMHCSGIAR